MQPIAPPAIKIIELLQMIGPPPGFTQGQTAEGAFQAYASAVSKARDVARMHFLLAGKLASGMMIAVFNNEEDCACAFIAIGEGMMLRSSMRKAGSKIIRFDDEDSFIHTTLSSNSKQSPLTPHDKVRYRFKALGRTTHAVIMIAAPDRRIEDRDTLDAFFKNLVKFFNRCVRYPRVLQESVESRELHNRERIEAIKLDLRARLDELVSPHITMLKTKFEQKVIRDDYGNEDYTRSLGEVDYFVRHVIQPRCRVSAEEVGVLHEVILDMILSARKEVIAESVNVEDLTPIAFEEHCAKILRESGWRARATKASGDQGVDIIATYAECKAVIQCKKFASPVGNKAVQEVLAGKAFEKADFAAVVSNASYTLAAKQLAAVSGVLLLHFEDLRGLAAAWGLTVD